MFQFSPNLSAGCRWHFVIGLDQGCCSFNSHPTSRLGAGGASYSLFFVSILARPLGWVQVAVTIALLCFNSHPTSRLGQLRHTPASHSSPGVSILTQPLGRVQLHTGGRIAGACSCFNPYPTSQLGAAGDIVNDHRAFPVSILIQLRGWVQPSLSSPTSCWDRLVSILTQPIGWVQLRWGSRMGRRR